MRPRRKPDTAPKEAPSPGRITAIDQQQRDPDRMSIFIDGEFAFGIHIDVQLEHRLIVGQELSAEDIEVLLAADEATRAVTAALNLISYRARASGELAQRLRQKGLSAASIDHALQRVRDLGYVDDADFAERWVASRQQSKPRSARALGQELRQKGIDHDLAADVIEDAGIDEVGDAIDLARSRAGSMAHLDPDTRKRRLVGFLSRRGYGWDVIKQAMNALDEPDG